MMRSDSDHMKPRINMLEAQLKAVLTSAPIAVYVVDSEGRFEFAEGRVLTNLGLSPEQVIGQRAIDLFAGMPQVEENVRRGLNGERVTGIIDLGTLVYQVTFLPHADGGFIGISVDITNWKRAEEDAHRQREFMRKVLDTLPIGIFWKDMNHVFQGCSQIVAQDAGLASPDDIIGKTDYDMPWAEQAAAFQADERAVMESGEPRLGVEEFWTRSDGGVRCMRVSKVPLRDTRGNVSGILGVYEDITEAKRAQQEREQLQQQVIEVQRKALADLSTPIIPVMDGIIVMPLIGSIDTARARDITRALLSGISRYRARIAILDITGVPLVDSGVADHLNRTIQAARLKGTYAIVTGISDAVAETIVDLGIDWSRVETLADLQSGLMRALERVGTVVKPGNGDNA